MTEKTIKLGGAALVCFAIALGGCRGDGPEQLMKTAKFEELQRNPEHARELYQRIVEQFPDSAEAGTARERIAALAREP